MGTSAAADGVHPAEVSKIYNGGESERMAIDFGSVSESKTYRPATCS